MKKDRPKIDPKVLARSKRLLRVEPIILLTFGATIMAVVVAAVHLA
jgi:hypothetical protein